MTDLAEKAIQNVLIVGAGWVGRQIAARFSLYGVDSVLTDSVSDVIDDVVEWINEIHRTQRPQENKNGNYSVAPVLGQLDDIWVQSQEIDLVIECVPEQVSIKKRVLKKLGQLSPAPVIIASNSSYFVPSLLSKYVAAPERFANIHFHVPVLKDSVVDIVGSASTLPQVVSRLKELTERIGHEPLMLRNEHPGYVFNWILQAVLKSSLELAALDVADPQDIDKSWKAVTGMPVGPFGMMDRIGLDVIEQVLSNSKWSDIPGATIEDMQKILTALTDSGNLGVKSGQGFYSYDDNPNKGIA